MALEENIGFLGRVPIDTKLVTLLDEVAKGNLPVGEEVAENVDQEGKVVFPLLDRYLETKSAQIWKEITEDLVEKVRERGERARRELEESETRSGA